MANLIRDEIIRENGYVRFEAIPGMEQTSYKLPLQVYQAIKNYPSYFRAGSVGPDFFPDLIMGQMTIHPTNSGEWLKLMEDELSSISPRDSEYMKDLAFYLGFMLHYAGDMFTHAYVNSYAKGWFPSIKGILKHLSSANLQEINRGTEEIRIIIRHLAIETYLDKYIQEQMEQYGHVEELHLDLPLTYIRSCFATAGAIKRGKDITGDTESGTMSFQFLEQYQEYLNELQEQSLIGSSNSLLENMKEREAYIDDWLKFFENFAEKSTRLGISTAYDESEDDIIRFLQAYYFKDEGKRNFTEGLLDFFDILSEINILKPLTDYVKDIIKGEVKEIVFPYLRPIASEVSGKPESRIHNFDEAIKTIKDTFLNVEYLLRNKTLFTEKNLPERLKAEWGNLGQYRDTLKQDFLEMSQAITMGKLCILGVDNLNSIINKYTEGGVKHYFTKREICWSVRELQVIVTTSKERNADTDKDLYFGIVTTDDTVNKPMEFILDKPNHDDLERGKTDVYRIILPMTIPLRNIRAFSLRLKGRDMWIGSKISIVDAQTGIVLANEQGIKLHDKESVQFAPFQDYDEQYEKQSAIGSILSLSITIKTSSSMWSGTDNDVFFCLYTDHGRYEKLLDKNWYNDFEMGDLDTYYMDLKQPIKLEQIRNFSLRKNGNDDWKVNYIQVHDRNTGICLAKKDIYQKIGKKEYIIECLQAETILNGDSLDESNLEKLMVTIKTSNKRWSGTNDDVYFEVYYMEHQGDKAEKKCFRYYLDTSWHDDFERGDTDSFHIKLKKKIRTSDLVAFRLYKKGSDDWYVDSVRVDDAARGYCLCNHVEHKKLITKNDEIYIEDGYWYS